jgi:N-acetylneuraminic acid mutarotase
VKGVPDKCRLFSPGFYAAVVSLAFASAAIHAAGTWRREPDMPTARSAHAVVATADAIYALAGTGGDGRPVLEVERFDGTRWSRVATLPGEGINAPAAAAIGDDIYLIGGFGTTTNQPLARVSRFNVRTGNWSDDTPLPAPRGGHAAVVHSGMIHVIGGGNSVSTIADHSVFDPRTRRWVDKAPLPRRMGSPTAVSLGNRMVSIGGRSGSSDFGDVYFYDPASDAWTAGPSSAPRGTAGAVALKGTVYLFGGEAQAATRVLDSVLRLDPGAAAWVADTPMPTARNFARAVLFKDAIYVVGGSTSYGSSHASRGAGVVERFKAD